MTDDVTVTGDIVAHLFASTSGSDSDWVVKLIDVYPAEYPADPRMANYQLTVAGEIFRGRYRRNFAKAQAIEPNKVNEYVIDLRGNDYTFKKGHRMMVQIQSSWFPLYDRNPQKFVENIFRAKESDYRAATQRIHVLGKIPFTHQRFNSRSLIDATARQDAASSIRLCFFSFRRNSASVTSAFGLLRQRNERTTFSYVFISPPHGVSDEYWSGFKRRLVLEKEER